MPPQEKTSTSFRNRSVKTASNDGTNGGAEAVNLMPGFRVKYPTNRDCLLKNADIWLDGRRQDDALDPNLWRVHDKLYDLSAFLDKHPGGRFWLETTRGTDITEIFESSHLNPSVVKVLNKYYVSDITIKRNSPYTFKDDGFYRTLKRKAWPILSKSGTGPSLRMKVMQDSMVLLFLTLMLLTAYHHSYLLAAATGVCLAAVISMSHNFFHQADNFRMLYFDLSTLSSAEWRITHGISHHHFTNTLYDYEIAALEPYIHYLPNPNKPWFSKYLSPITCHLILFIVFFMELILRVVGVAVGRRKFRPENLFPVAEALIMVFVAGDLKIGLSLWSVMVFFGGFMFAYPALIGSHHHPDIYHAHDTFRSNPDWGLCQLDAVRDKVEATGSLFLVTTTFGDHSLHHLFPTVDHSKLPLLYPVFLETCRQFGIRFTFLRQSNLWLGMYRQLVSTTPNLNPPGYKEEGEILLPKSVIEMRKVAEKAGKK